MQLNPNSTSAYPSRAASSALYALGLFFVLVILLKSGTTDYREASKSYLLNSGMSNEAVDAAVPKTRSERIRDAKSQAERSADMERVLEVISNMVLTEHGEELKTEERLVLEKFLKTTTTTTTNT
mmetsp:Transcript_23299/g.48391  ORF Transcript_23299/g.48391 Transcript_23299/m.48391 type:complete len:125 (-) Transcript_23299:30-404(-)